MMVNVQKTNRKTKADEIKALFDENSQIKNMSYFVLNLQVNIFYIEQRVNNGDFIY